MKILMVTATYRPSLNGIAVSIVNLASELRTQGHQVNILAPKHSEAVYEPGVIRYPSIENPLVSDYPIPLFPGIRSILELMDEGQFDIIHTHHPFHIGSFAWFLAKRYRVPLVFTFHTNYDLYSENYLQFLPAKLKAEFINNRIYDYCQKVDMVVFPSKFMQKKFEKLELESTIIRTAVSEIVKSEESKDEIRERLKIPTEKRILLCVARLSQEKNVNLLIDAMKLVDDSYCLLLIGTGPLEELLRERIVQENMQEKVILTGKIERERISDYYNLADYFMFSSVSETQGLIFLEALTVGLPIVAVRSQAAEEWIDNEFGILTENSPESLAEGVSQLASRDYLNMSEAALKAASVHSTEEMAEQMIELYQRLIDNKD